MYIELFSIDEDLFEFFIFFDDRVDLADDAESYFKAVDLLILGKGDFYLGHSGEGLVDIECPDMLE